MESYLLPADADGRQCRAWADSHPAASCRTDREILNHLAFLWTRNDGLDRFCKIGFNKLADKIGASRRTVIRRINKLVESGAIVRKHEYGKAGEQRGNSYAFPVEVSPPPVSKCHPPQCQSVTPPSDTMTPPTRAGEEVYRSEDQRSEDRESCIQDHKIQIAGGGIERSENPPQTPPFENGKSKPYEHTGRLPDESQADYERRLLKALGHDRLLNTTTR